jgi:phosphate starvation-inducible PhoH-like protein
MKDKSDNKKIEYTFSDINLAKQLFGEHNSNLQRIADALNITINARGNTVFIQGDSIAVKLAQNILEQLYGLLKDNYPVYSNDVDYAIRVLSEDDSFNLKEIFLDTVYVTSKKHSITPKSPAQKEYIDAIRKYDMVFGIGPAGTGKTYLAMAMAVAALSGCRTFRRAG